MKKAVIFLFILIEYQLCYAQSTIYELAGAGHGPPANPILYWSGWNNTTTIPFNVEHRGFGVNQTINFLTNGVQRMTILNSGIPGIPPFAYELK